MDIKSSLIKEAASLESFANNLGYLFGKADNVVKQTAGAAKNTTAKAFEVAGETKDKIDDIYNTFNNVRDKSQKAYNWTVNEGPTFARNTAMIGGAALGAGWVAKKIINSAMENRAFRNKIKNVANSASPYIERGVTNPIVNAISNNGLNVTNALEQHGSSIANSISENTNAFNNHSVTNAEYLKNILNSMHDMSNGMHNMRVGNEALLKNQQRTYLNNAAIGLGGLGAGAIVGSQVFNNKEAGLLDELSNPELKEGLRKFMRERQRDLEIAAEKAHLEGQVHDANHLLNSAINNTQHIHNLNNHIESLTNNLTHQNLAMNNLQNNLINHHTQMSAENLAELKKHNLINNLAIASGATTLGVGANYLLNQERR